MSLSQIIEDDYKNAFKNGHKLAIGVLRMLKTELHNALIAQRGKVDSVEELNDESALAIVQRQVKQLEEAKEMFVQGGRNDLAAQNLAEIAILKKYLPELLTEQAIREAVKKIIAESGASRSADFGKVMGLAMKELKGKADGQMVGQIVKELLAG